MKVLYVLHTSKAGGAAESLKVLLSQWRHPEYRIEPLIALPRGPVYDELHGFGWPVFPLPAGWEMSPRSFRGMTMALATVLLHQRALVRIIRNEKVDIVHANATAAHAASGAAGRACHIPTVWHVRDLTKLGRWSTPLARRADAIVAISKTVALALESQNVPRHKIHQIYNSLNTEDWTPQTPPDIEIRNAFNATSSTVIFGCVGQLVPWKNQDMFIEAAAMVRDLTSEKNIKFAIIGSDPWQKDSAFRRRLIAHARALRLHEDLIFFPHQDDNRAALAACDVLVHAAQAEPFGRVVIEAMALQKPVIAFAAAGPSEILTHKRNGCLVSPESGSAGLAEAMRKVLLSASLRQELGRAARFTVQERFNARDGAVRIKEVYRKLV